MKPLNVGVVGCGQIAQIMHIPYLWDLPEFNITAICDLSQSVVSALGRKYNISNLYTDYRELVVQEDLDVVAVLSPDHADVAEAAAEAGKHVFVEKPFCFSLADCDRVLRSVKNNRIKLMVGYMKRYDPGFNYGSQVMKLMDDIRMIRVHDYTGDFSNHQALFDLYTGNDVAQYLLAEMNNSINEKMKLALGKDHAHLHRLLWELLMSSHDIDILQGVFGPPQHVLFSDAISNTEFLSVMEYGKSKRCVFEIGIWANYHYWDEQLTAYGKNSIVSINFPNPYIKNAPTHVKITCHEDGNSIQKDIQTSFQEAFRIEWQHFFKCIENDSEPITNGEVGRADVELAIEMIKALKT